MDHRTDELLIARAKQGDDEAFEQLFEKYKHRVFKIAQKWLRHREDAEDATLEIFVLAWRSLNRFRGACPFYSWLVKIAKNLCKNKRRTRRHAVPTDIVSDLVPDAFTPEDGEAFVEWLVGAAPGGDPGEILMNKQLGETIQNATKQLPPDLQAVFVLMDIDGLTETEVAEHLHKPVGTVRRRKYEARQKMRALLAPYLDGQYPLSTESCALHSNTRIMR